MSLRRRSGQGWGPMELTSETSPRLERPRQLINGTCGSMPAWVIVSFCLCGGGQLLFIEQLRLNRNEIGISPWVPLGSLVWGGQRLGSTRILVVAAVWPARRASASDRAEGRPRRARAVPDRAASGDGHDAGNVLGSPSRCQFPAPCLAAGFWVWSVGPVASQRRPEWDPKVYVPMLFHGHPRSGSIRPHRWSDSASADQPCRLG